MTSRNDTRSAARAKLLGSAAAICMAAGAWSSAAIAQTAAAPADAPPPQRETSGGIQEIVVTAQRRQESTQDIPVAISALGKETLENIGFQRPTDVAANGSYRSRQWYSAYNGSSGYDRIQQKAYTLINGRFGLSSPDRGYSIALWGKNLLNTKYDSYAINLQSGLGYDYFLTGMLRTYGVEVGYKFLKMPQRGSLATL